LFNGNESLVCAAKKPLLITERMPVAMVKPNSNEYEHGIESMGNAIIFLVLLLGRAVFQRKGEIWF